MSKIAPSVTQASITYRGQSGGLRDPHRYIPAQSMHNSEDGQVKQPQKKRRKVNKAADVDKHQETQVRSPRSRTSFVSGGADHPVYLAQITRADWFPTCRIFLKAE